MKWQGRPRCDVIGPLVVLRHGVLHIVTGGDASCGLLAVVPTIGLLTTQRQPAPAASHARPTPAQPGAMPLDDRARQIFQYFKTYNYEASMLCSAQQSTSFAHPRLTSAGSWGTLSSSEPCCSCRPCRRWSPRARSSYLRASTAPATVSAALGGATVGGRPAVSGLAAGAVGCR